MTKKLPGETKYLGGIRTVEDLAARCRIDELTDCWIWRLSLSLGAPHVCIIGLDGKRTSIRGRRAALILAGQHIPKGHLAVARIFCRNPLCVNPAHCRVASTKEAWKAKVESGELKGLPSKVAAQKAQAMKRRQLTDDMASEIRSSDEDVAELAKRFGVKRNVVRDVLKGKTYKPTGASVFSWRPA